MTYLTHSPAPICAGFERWLTASWQTDRRYYQAEITQDLFGTWLLKRSWGGLSNKRGNSKTYPFTEYDDAMKHFEFVMRRREKRGYGGVT